jgi:cob(I)alamin adenosyltransferase
MHELAGRGDDGTTGLLGGGRTAKDDLRIEANGAVDEASSALGLARALSAEPRVREVVEELQRGLYRVGAELSTGPEHTGRFVTTGAEDVARLDALLVELEAEVTMPREFILPGATPASGALDLARAVVRRAERRCVTLRRAGTIENPEVGRWLNRLSLLVFVLARFEEQRVGTSAGTARERPGSDRRPR